MDVILAPVTSCADFVTFEGFPLYWMDAAELALAVILSVVLIFTLDPEDASTTADFVTKSPAETELPLLALITLVLAVPDNFKELPLLASIATDFVSRLILTLDPDSTSKAVFVEILNIPETNEPELLLKASVVSLTGVIALKDAPDFVTSLDNFGLETTTFK